MSFIHIKQRNAWFAGKTEIQKILFLSCAFSFLLTLVRILVTGQLLFAWLNWNLFLAIIPYWLTCFLMRNPHWIEQHRRFFPILVTWLLFLPNSFYMITDLFHLDHRFPVPLWFDTALIFSFVWNGILLGFITIRHMETIFQVKFDRSGSVLIGPLMLLNAFGIYVGRYLRYNTWDVLMNPFALVQDIGYLLVHPLRNRHDWEMIGCYSVVIALVYLSLKKLGKAVA